MAGPELKNVEPSLETLSVSGAYLNTLLATAAQFGLSRNAILQEVALDGLTLDDKEKRIPASLFLSLLSCIAGHPGCDDIGLHMAELARPGTFSALGYAAMSCATLGEAASLIAHYEDLVLDVGCTTLQIDNALAMLGWRAKLPAMAIRPLHDAIVAGWFCFAQWVTGITHLSPRKISFAHARPADISHYQRLFACDMEFSAPLNAIVFDAAFLQIPIVQADHDFNRLMREKADAVLAQLAASGSLRQRLVSWLQTNLPRQQASLYNAAQALGLSERTLRRRLADEHTSFQQLLTEVRVRLASLYLKDPQPNLLDIALLLGYADQSAFTAAFKAWHGITPGHWREEFQLSSAGHD